MTFVTSPTDDETVDAIQSPALTIVKAIISGDPYAAVSDVISYSFLVTNSGNVSLAGPVSINDDKALDESCPDVNTVGNNDGFLDPTEFITCTASYTVDQADLNAGFVTNIADASADGTTSLTDTQTADATQSPALTLLKTAQTFADTNSDGLAGGAGDLVTYEYTVTNTGNVTLIDITLSDDNGTPGVLGDDLTPTLVGLTDEDADNSLDDLAPLAFATATATHLITEGEFILGSLTNIAIATGESSTGTVFDTATVTVEFPLPPAGSCELLVDKSCCVLPPPSANGGTDCEGKVVEAIFRYTGEDCSATTNDQGGKLKCIGVIGGDPNNFDPLFPNQFLEPVDIVLKGKGADKINISTEFGGTSLAVGDYIAFSHVDAGKTLGGHTEFDLEGFFGMQSLKIHTSCSKPLNVGDQFGSMQLIQLTSTEGGTVTLPDGNELTACVMGGDPLGTTCDRRLTEVVFKYDVNGLCEDPLANPQGGKASCEDLAALTLADLGNMTLVYTGKDPDKFTVTQDPFDPTIFKLTTTRKELHSDTKLEIRDSADNLLQKLKFHASCSQPLSLGDVFGALTIVEFSTKDGGQFVLPDPEPPAPNNMCTIELPPAGPHCTSKPTSLTFRYLGGDCSISNIQEGKATCVQYGDDLGVTDSVRIVVTGTKKDAGRTYLDTGASPADVKVGDIVTALASAGGSSKFGSSTIAKIYDIDGLLRQTIEFHTSCSKELNLGDRFGGLEVFGMDSKEGGAISLGAMIEYEYTITNPTDFLVTGVTVTDDLLGVIASDESIPPGETLTFFERVLVTETTFNTVSVTADGIGTACTAEATVFVEEPIVDPGDPLSLDACAAGKPFELVFEYVGQSCAFSTTDQNGKFDCVDRVNPAINGALPVQIVVTKKPEDVDVTTSPTAQTITTLDSPLITFTSTDGRLNSSTRFDIVQNGVVLQSLNIHTSCSAPLNVGDQFGAVILREFTPQQ